MKESKYKNQTAEEILSEYLKALNKAKIRQMLFYMLEMIAIIYICLFSNISTGVREIIYLFIIVAAFIAHFSFQVKSGIRCGELSEILTTDCEPCKYLEIMRSLDKKDTRGRGHATFSLECAVANYYDGDMEEALTYLREVEFKSPKNFRYIKKYNIEGLIYCYLREEEGYRQAMNQLYQEHKTCKEGTVYYNLSAKMIQNLQLNWKPFVEWDEEDRIYVEEQLAQEPNRLIELSLQLSLAKYEALHGDREKSEQYLDLALEGQVPAVYERRIREVNELLGNHL